MEKRSYNNMYKPKTLKEINEEVAAPVEELSKSEEAPAEEVTDKVEEEVVEEAAKVEEPKVKKTGVVTGGLNLNVRKAPGAEIIKAIPTGTKVTIEDDSDAEWYKISEPVAGFVMKKFITI